MGAIDTARNKLPDGYSIIFINSRDNDKNVTEKTEVILKCDKGHQKRTKIRNIRDKKSDFCTICNLENKKLLTLENTKKELQSLSNHNILNIANRVVTYICFYCENTVTSLDSAFRAKPDKRCKHCLSETTKNTYEKIKNIFETEIKNFELLTTKLEFDEKYENKEFKLRLKCKNCENDNYFVRLAEAKTNKACPNCVSSVRSQTFIEKYGEGFDNAMKIPEFKEKQRESVFKHFGVYFPQQSAEVRNKTTATSLKKYGAVRAFAREEVYKKIREIHKNNHGFEFPLQSKDIQKKCEESCIKTTGERKPFMAKEYFLKTIGFSHPMKSKECRDKFTDTMIKRYGVPHAMQNPVIFRLAIKKMFSSYKYKFPSGRTVNIQGYEKHAINMLLNDGIDENDIIVEDDVPVFQYTMNNKNNKSQHTYYPDIYIKSTNTIIEVKSPWIYNKDAYRNYRKGISVAKNGYIFDIWIITDKGKLIMSIQFKKRKNTNKIAITYTDLPNFRLKTPYNFKNYDVNISIDERAEYETMIKDEINNIADDELYELYDKITNNENIDYIESESENIDNLEINDIIPSYFKYLDVSEIQKIIQDIQINYPKCSVILDENRDNMIEQLKNAKNILINKYGILESSKMFNIDELDVKSKSDLSNIINNINNEYNIELPSYKSRDKIIKLLLTL